MATTTNGSAKSLKMNGIAYVNGVNGISQVNGVNGINGHIKKESMNGHAIVPRRRAPARGSGLFARTLSIVARLFTWYSIFTILFRCPASLKDTTATTPPICKPYFQIKHAVTPQLEPYYYTYAAPYVALAQPYYQVVDRKVLTPSWGYASKYGAPRVAQAQAYGKAQWDRNVQPQLLQYQKIAKSQYDQNLGPHVDRASTVVAPYYDIARTNALQTYHGILMPSYRFASPYAQEGLRRTSDFTTNAAMPGALWAWNQAYSFLDGTVWPQVRVIYVEKVEPQLVKIGDRLGRHSAKAPTQKPIVEHITSSISKAVSSFTKPSSSITSATSVPSSSAVEASSISVASNPAAVKTSGPGVTEPAVLHGEQVQAPELEDGEVENEERRVARLTVAQDLKDWQERYAKAADEGATEIDDRVDEISKHLIRRNAKVTGKGLLESLQSVTVSGLVTLRRDIVQITGAVVKGGATKAQGREELTSVVRKAGVEIKDAAKQVRTWREQYEHDLHAAITEAAANHFSILDSIRDLAIQKLGMKWAWMDSITYKDWEKYHELKSRFDEWHGDLELLIVNHPSLEAAHLEGAKIEEDAMELAQNAAKELQRLKQVGVWKLAAHDDSTEFDSELMRKAAEAAGNASDSVSDVNDEAIDSAVEPVGEAVSIFETVENSATSAVVGHADNLSSVATNSALSASSIVSTSVKAASSAVESLAKSISSQASSFAQETPLPTLSKLVSKGAEKLSSASSAATSVAHQDSSSVDSAASGGKSILPAAVAGSSLDTASAASPIVLEGTPSAVGKTSVTTALDDEALTPVQLPVDELVNGGAAAPINVPIEHVLDDQPIVINSVPTRSSTTTSVKSVMFGAAAQSVPSRKPILEDALDDDSFGSAGSVISSIRNEYPSSFSSMAQSAYSAAKSRADMQYSQALSLVSAQISGTPKPVHQQMLASVTSGYSVAMASASSHLDGALREAKKQFGATPTTNNILPTAISIPAVPTVDWASIEAIASERLNQGRAWAEEQYGSAKIAIGLATPAPSTPAEHADKLLENARLNYYAAIGMAYARYSDFTSAASTAFSSMTASPTPTDLSGTASSIASVASASASSIVSVAGESASAVASAATASASSAAMVAGDSASSLAAAASDAAASGYNTVASAASVGYDSASSVASAGYDSASSAASVGYNSASSVASAGYDNVASAANAGYDTVASAGASAGEVIANSWDSVVNQLSVQVYGAPTPTAWYASFYSAAGGYGSSATSAAGSNAAAVTSAAGTYVSAASSQAAAQYASVSSLLAELLVGKEPTFSESVYSRLDSAYTGSFASASSLASVAQASAASIASSVSYNVASVGEKVVSAASEATEVVKETVQHYKDEL